MDTKNKYDRIAQNYDKIEKMMFFNKYRKNLVNLVRGNVLEVGVGTGLNLPYYSKDVSVTAIDFSPKMLKKAEKIIFEKNIKNINLAEMDIQNINFNDNTFDSVVSTCVFCTVPDPDAGLMEVYRVLKPGGRAFFMEHMRSENTVINLMLFMINFISKIILGTSMLRKTQESIERAGFKAIERKDIFFDVVRIIIAEK